MIYDCLRKVEHLMARFDLFRDLLPRSAALAAEKGHEYLDSFHCFDVLARDYGDSDAVRPALGAQRASAVDSILWSLVRVEAPLQDVADVTPAFLFMADSVAADAYCLGRWQPTVAHLSLFFLTRPTCIPYTVHEKLGVNRTEAIHKIAVECVDGSPQYAEAVAQYYLGLHDCLRAVAQDRFKYGRVIWDTRERPPS